MQKSASEGSSFDEQGARGSEVAGGADNVQKTSYVVGHGTDPDAPDPPGYAATVRSGGANVGLWIVAAVAVLIGLVYAFGLFR